MSIISEKSAQALRNNTEYKNNNTQVYNGAMFLHGNKIAWIEGARLYFCLCGWDSRTTCERLRALGLNIYHKKTRLMHGQQEINARNVYFVYMEKYNPSASLAFNA